MTYFGLINYEKCTEWDLGKTTVHLMPVFADLEGWATAVPSNDPSDQRPFYLLYREKILSDIPYLGSVSSISRSISELETKGIIECANKYNAPAYRLTAKGLSWKRKPEQNEKPKDGETDPSKPTPPKEPKQKKEPRRHAFSLPKKCLIDECDEEYMKLLREEAYKKCDKDGIPREEYMSFVRYYMKSDVKWRNWAAVFGDWLKRYKDKPQPNGGEFVKGGLY